MHMITVPIFRSVLCCLILLRQLILRQPSALAHFSRSIKSRMTFCGRFSSRILWRTQNVLGLASHNASSTNLGKRKQRKVGYNISTLKLAIWILTGKYLGKL
ncbi:uncharacterized protein PAC_00145 [Phialocephala subalpina]|uniref:Secreted protein n=1 Tax=Phialocephala subalpina TaxID=576137 RepID=A0A1L7WBW5_9HELO|nr:uncharacterized protein PAC_00145 [Phialocephala subalpina]